MPHDESLAAQVERTAAQLTAADPAAVRVVAAPYRICPLGAHVDHQGGAVLGAAIDAYTVLAFAPSADGRVQLTSEDFAGTIRFSAAAAPSLPATQDWGRYARGAAVALHQLYPDQIKTGFVGHISGRLLGAGLSSSASAGVAYLMAFAAVNRLCPTPAQLVELDRLIENRYLGLNNGVQDQTTIIYGRKDALVHQETDQRVVTHLPHPANVADVAWLVIFSGFTRELTDSGFNTRVSECWAAAEQLQAGAKRLGDVSVQSYQAHKQRLPADLQKRAAHYFSETERVAAGKAAWLAGDFVTFGDAMNRSCHSSIHQYECGSPPLIRLHEIASQTAGVLGSRFSGGGYGGCLVALVAQSQAERALEMILERYRAAFPEKAAVCAGWIAHGVDGAAFVR